VDICNTQCITYTRGIICTRGITYTHRRDALQCVSTYMPHRHFIYKLAY